MTPTIEQVAACERFLLKARSELGVVESPGEADTPRVLDYLRTVGKAPWFVRDATPWCSAFANWVTLQCDVKGSGKANARSWLKWGDGLVVPTPGCVVVFSRPPSPLQGHVSFFVRQLGDQVWVLGGNQGNAVSIKPYPARRLLGYRVPSPTTLTALAPGPRVP